MMFAGLIGAACPGPSTAGVGISLATGTLARRIVWIGAALLAAVAASPKVLELFVLIPEPVKAAMLFYVAGYIMAQGCQRVTAMAPRAFASGLPELASPLAAGSLVALLAHLLTLPLVARRARLPLARETDMQQRARGWFEKLGANWALKPQTVRSVLQSLPELLDLLGELQVQDPEVAARLAEDRVELTLRWRGAGLPEVPERIDPQDLLGPNEVRHRFVLWMAIKYAQAHRLRDEGDLRQAWLAFDD